MASATSLPLLQLKMNTQIKQVQDWLLANRLSVHYVDKSQYMLINSNISSRIDEGSFKLTMGDHILARTKTYCYLGVIMDDKLSWGEHINDLCLKLSQIAGIIYKTRTLLSQKARLLIYHSLVSSKLRYGLICWGTASKFLLKKINDAHNKIIRYLTFSKPCSRAWPLYCKLKVLPLEILIQIEWGKIVYRHKSHTLPPVFTPQHRGVLS